MITTVNVCGVDVATEKAGHLAICPAILQDEDTKDFFERVEPFADWSQHEPKLDLSEADTASTRVSKPTRCSENDPRRRAAQG